MIIDLNAASNNDKPEDIKAIQEETIDSIKEYLPELIRGINNVIPEVKGDEKEDTWEYLRMIIDGFNWVIEAYNGTSSILNPDGIIDNKDVSSKVDDLGRAYRNHDGNAVGEILENDIVPFINKLKELADSYK